MEETKVAHKKKTLAPKLRFKGFNDEWKNKKLGDVSIFLDGRRKPIKSEDRAKMKGEYPYYGASGIIDYVNNYLFDEEIILLGEDGENIISRNLPLAFRVSGKCWINNHAHVIKPNSDTNIDFLTHNLERTNYEIYNTGTAQPKLNQEVCRNIPSYFPTLSEQQKIASFLSAVDEKIQQLTRKKELLEQYKKGVMQQLFSGKLRFKPNEVAEGTRSYPKWEEKRLGDVCDSISSGKSKNIDNGTFPLYGSTGIIGNCLDYSHDGVFILIARVGANAGTINLVEGKFGVSDNTLVVICNEQLNIEYIYFYLEFYNLNKLIFGSGQPLITGGQLKDLNLNLPSLSEQKKIANYLSNIDNKIEIVNKQITQTQTFKKGLLQQMFV